MLLDLAEALTPLLSARKERMASGNGILIDGLDEEEAGETTLQLLFFDGEEAFHDWTATDSIYGAR
jgi:glutaminyl-peptide cyclotransferase